MGEDTVDIEVKRNDTNKYINMETVETMISRT